MRLDLIFDKIIFCKDREEEDLEVVVVETVVKRVTRDTIHSNVSVTSVTWVKCIKYYLRRHDHLTTENINNPTSTIMFQIS